MKILIAEDEKISRLLLTKFLTKWNHEVISSVDGDECFELLNKTKAQLLIADWMMPRMSGIDLIKKIRAENRSDYVYIIVLTAKSELSDMVEGFSAGADDYLTKPFYPQELEKRVNVGVKTVKLHNELRANVEKLEKALSKVRMLEGMLPICMYCKKIRDDKNYWVKVEDYISSHSDAKLSHGICPECYEKEFGEKPG